MADVYFLDLTKSYRKNVIEMFEKLIDVSGGLKIIDKSTTCAVKLHVGEHGNVNFVSPEYVKKVTDMINRAGGFSFLTDTTTLYSGRRHRADLHIDLAKEHGFDFAPFIVGDGLLGDEYVDIDGAKIASLFSHIDTMVCISHFKGHFNCGFGGALKNLGMGCASKGGKLEIHSKSKPYIDVEKCTHCRKCLEYCLYNAIAERNGDMIIDQAECIGCCGCMSMCADRAIKFQWNAASADIQKGIAKYAARVIENKSVFYINFLINITPNCDCFHTNEPMLAPDVGILASFDPVSLDKACYDLIKKPIDNLHPDVDSQVQIKFAEEYKAGESKYEIRRI
ncbi:MAG: DUF362 domain-containing protein [bacterium]